MPPPTVAPRILLDQLHTITTRLVRQIVHRSHRSQRCPLNPSKVFPVPAHLQIPITRVARQPLDGPVGQDARRPLRPAGPGLGETRDPAPDLLAEEVDDRADDGRQTRADDADGAFETAPEREFVVVVGRVRVRSEERYVLQAHHAADCNKESNGEDHRYGDPGPRVLD